MAPTVANKEDVKSKSKKGDTKKNLLKKQAKSQNAYNFPSEFLRIKCPICFDNISKDSVSSTKCGHVFCTECLQKALKSFSACPTCRTRLRGSRSHHQLYFDTCSVSETDSNSDGGMKQID